MRYAFTNADGIVVQVLTGDLAPIVQAQFLADYDVLFGAVNIIPVVDADTSVWIGGSYTDGTFIAPPAPLEPEVPSDPLPS
jgi:hypothetical protein